MKQLAIAVTVCLAALVAAAPSEAQGWRKYTAPDRGFSFHYPNGWTVKTEESVIEVNRDQSQEQLLIVAVPFDARKSPRQHADVMVDAFRKGGMRDLRPSAWRAEGASVYFRIEYTDDGVPYDGDVVVLKDEGTAHWFSYTAPAEGYTRREALVLLQAVIGSVSPGGGSRAPSGPPPVTRAAAQPEEIAPRASTRQQPADDDRISRNAHAVLWVMEFALGNPLSAEQEHAVVGKLRAVWSRKSEADVAEYDTYPQALQKILGLGQRELEEVREQLAGTFRGWFQASNSSEPIVVALRDAFTARPRVVANGTPALTETAATAYAELMTYAELLNEDPQADPEDVSPSAVREMRRRLIGEWSQLSQRDREQVMTVPGVWICSRTLIRYGKPAERNTTRQKLSRLAPARNAGHDERDATGGASRPMDMTTHSVLMQMNQMTFNNYLWSRGFKTTAFGY